MIGIKQAAQQLETIIVKLEKWQAKHGHHDQSRNANQAKQSLISLLREIER